MSRKRTAAGAGLDQADVSNAEIPGFWQEAERQASTLYSDDTVYDAVPLLLLASSSSSSCAAAAASTATTEQTATSHSAPGSS
jgi:hypothetical protein